MGAVYSWQQAIKESGLGSNKRFSTTNYVAGQDTSDQLVQPPKGYYLPYFIIDFSMVVTNTATTTNTPASTVAGATTDVLDLFINRLELKDAIGGIQRTQLTNRVDIEEAERIALNLPFYAVPFNGTSATYAAYNLPGAYPRAAPPTIAGSGTATITASLRVPYGSDVPGEGCYVVFSMPQPSAVYSTATFSAPTVGFREAYHPHASGAWAFQSVRPPVINSGIQDVAQYIPENQSPYFVDFTHATVTTTSGTSTNTFTQSLFQAPGLNRLQDTTYSIIEANTLGYPDVANPLPNYGTVANCVSDVVPFSTHGLRPIIWNLNIASNSTQLDMVIAQFSGKQAAIAPSPAEPTKGVAKVAVGADHQPSAGPSTIRDTSRMTLGAANAFWQSARRALTPTGGSFRAGRAVA
ncbi:MAG: hypothetical protein L3K19_09480 [Thermoplasmata archaeon]|nr:hypothetical protein [Thermoplasmata archaeon]